MRCVTIQDRLDAYSTGELSARAAERIEKHLASCAECRSALARLRGLTSLLRSVPPPPALAHLAERIQAQALQQLQTKPGTVAWHPIRWWMAAPVPMRLAAVVALAIGIALGAAMGHQTVRYAPRAATLPTKTAADDVRAIYALDPLADAPMESLAGVYLVARVEPECTKE